MKYIFLLIVVVFLGGCEPIPDQDKDQSWALLPFEKADEVNPILSHDTTSKFLCPVRNTIVQWEEKDVFNPAAVVRNDTVFLLFRAEDSIGKFAGTSRIGIAWSTDGLHFTKHPVPVLYPDNDSSKIYEWEGGCEDPRIVEDENGIYYMTYTAYDGDKARLLIATSKDLYHWTKHGPVFMTVFSGHYSKNAWSKSGSIVSEYKNGSPIAKKIKGRYWMYWGDTDIFIAYSNDLIHWIPQVGSVDVLISVIEPRPGKFDSDLVEPGPPAMITDSGIVLIYNSRNVTSKGDSSLAEGTYAASQILLDKNDPIHVIKRMDTYFMKPDKPYEITGQVNHVCFVEGLVNYKGKWFLYYGTADSKIAVAVK
jgi:beta-1,2-mannosidase